MRFVAYDWSPPIVPVTSNPLAYQRDLRSRFAKWAIVLAADGPAELRFALSGFDRPLDGAYRYEYMERWLEHVDLVAEGMKQRERPGSPFGLSSLASARTVGVLPVVGLRVARTVAEVAA